MVSEGCRAVRALTYLAVADESGQSPFERLERLTKQLLSVPKKELDARVEQAKREAKKRRTGA